MSRNCVSTDSAAVLGGDTHMPKWGGGGEDRGGISKGQYATKTSSNSGEKLSISAKEKLHISEHMTMAPRRK